MQKSILTVLLCGVMVLGLTGCGNKFDLLKGKWIATTKNQKVYQVNTNGDKIGSKEDYILECDGKGN